MQIADNGHGISPEHLAKIFDPFFTTKPVGVGTGLGLSIAFGIVEKHQGKISVTSEVGQGTRFTLLFPAI
ncbi:sensor histidine kinase [Vibrio cholerae]|nr:sensor histidine kinase [Vibrio cholerae]